MNNEVNYLIIDNNFKIVDGGIELIYTIHHFLQSVEFNRVTITPTSGTITLDVTSNGATQDDTTPRVEINCYKLKTITIDDENYTLVCYTLNSGVDEENGN